ncbi:MAG: carbamate kinase [Deltaproteobacteria bacterium]
MLDAPASERVVIVLGGNAFVKPGTPLTMAGQFRFARDALASLRPLFDGSRQVVITHGNGPQVGHILTRVEAALGKAYAIPLEVCVAESEGELGYVLQQTLYNLLSEWHAVRPIAGLVTQVVVDPHDPAFARPTKPIGLFYTGEQAAQLRQKGFVVNEDSGRGYRRMVPSPAPREVVEIDIVRVLLDAGALVICGGGGGIPVVREDGRLRGVEAVIDKDLTSALVATAIGARLMVILTGVPCAYRNFNSPRQEPLGRLSVHQTRQLLAEGHFPPGSMGPKIEAAIQFASQPKACAIICNPENLPAALQGNAGTIIRSSD